MTGKRVSRANPESEWLRQDVPELRIVDDEVWQTAQRMREARSGPRFYSKRRPQRLLSGLIFCGVCGSRYNVATRGYLRCSKRTNSGTCHESRMVLMGDVEQRVLASIERHLLAPKMVDAAVKAFHAEFERAAAELAGKQTGLEKELAEIDRKISRLLGLVEDGHADPAVAGPRLNELAGRKRELLAQLALKAGNGALPEMDDAGEHYRRLVKNLRVELGQDKEGNHEAVSLVRGLVTRIVVPPKGGKREPRSRSGSGVCDAGSR